MRNIVAMLLTSVALLVGSSEATEYVYTNSPKLKRAHTGFAETCPGCSRWGVKIVAWHWEKSSCRVLKKVGDQWVSMLVVTNIWTNTVTAIINYPPYEVCQMSGYSYTYTDLSGVVRHVYLGLVKIE